MVTVSIYSCVALEFCICDCLHALSIKLHEQIILHFSRDLKFNQNFNFCVCVNQNFNFCVCLFLQA